MNTEASMSVEELVKLLRDMGGGDHAVKTCHEAADKLEELAAKHDKLMDYAIEMMNRAVDAETALAEAKRENEALRDALTPSGETKAAYIGEFFEQIEIRNPDYDPDFDNPKHDEDPNDDEPETIMQSVPVSWNTIKEIMKAIAERATRNAGGNDA